MSSTELVSHHLSLAETWFSGWYKFVIFQFFCQIDQPPTCKLWSIDINNNNRYIRCICDGRGHMFLILNVKSASVSDFNAYWSILSQPVATFSFPPNNLLYSLFAITSLIDFMHCFIANKFYSCPSGLEILETCDSVLFHFTKKPIFSS